MDGPKGDGRRLLVLRALSLGDLLVAVPALRGLRRGYPDHRLIYAGPGWLAPVLRLVGGIDELLDTGGLGAPLAATGIDIAVNLHGSGPQSRERLEELAPRLRIGHRAPGWDGPGWTDEIHERERWTRLLRWHGIDADPLDHRLHPPAVQTEWPGAVVVHVGAGYGSRLWPAERFAEAARALAGHGHRVLFTGSGPEAPRALQVAAQAGLGPECVLAGRLSLDAFAAVIAAASLVISADTGAAHLASAYGRPSVVLFGPAPVSRWGPPPGPHIVLGGRGPRTGDVFASVPDPALLAVTAEDVLAAAGRLGIG